MKVVCRSVGALAIGMTLTVGSASLASASGHHDHGNKNGDVASGKISSFDYANIGHGGYVTAVTPTSVTVLGKNSTTPTTFTITTTTTYKDDGVSLSASDLAVGSKVGIEVSSAASTTALNIEIELAHLSGKVTSISGDTITIGGHEGSSRTILVASTTTYTKDGAPAKLADIVVGTKISGEGTLSADELTLTAVSVVIKNARVSTPDNDSQNSGHQGDQGSGDGAQGSSGQGQNSH